MSECPLCQTPVPDDFGLIECSGCGSPLIVHMDGRVEFNGSEPAQNDPAPIDEPPIEPFPESAEELSEEPPGELADEPVAESDHEFMDFSEPSPSVYQSASPASPDLSDVANFGNSDLSGGREGSLRYNLHIEGIDTSDVREAFREALTDRKLMWDTDQILRGIRQGAVSIPNVSPTKAHILISRLRNMPVTVRWEQYAISQT